MYVEPNSHKIILILVHNCKSYFERYQLSLEVVNLGVPAYTE